MKRLMRIKMFGVGAHTREFRDPDRWRTFFYNRLWIGLPVAPIVLFISGFLQRTLDEGVPTSTALSKSLIDIAAGTFCYAIGVWASTAPDEPRSEEAQDSHVRPWWGPWVGCGVILIFVALINAGQIEDYLHGEISLGRFLNAVFMKLVCVAAVVVPIWIASKRK